MTQTATQPESGLVMPPKIDLVREAIARLDTAGVRSQLMKLDSRTMEDLCTRLVDRELTWLSTYEWLNKELGGTPEEPVIDRNAVYRFKDNFVPRYEQVRAEHAQRIARLTVDHASAGNVAQMGRVAKLRLVNLVAERLVRADNIEDVTPAEMNLSLATIKALDEGEIKQQELALKFAEAERKAAKAESDLRIAEQKLADLPAKVKALEARIEQLSKAHQQGKTIDPSIFASIKAELLAMVPAGEKEAA